MLHSYVTDMAAHVTPTIQIPRDSLLYRLLNAFARSRYKMSIGSPFSIIPLSH